MIANAHETVFLPSTSEPNGKTEMMQRKIQHKIFMQTMAFVSRLNFEYHLFPFAFETVHSNSETRQTKRKTTIIVIEIFLGWTSSSSARTAECVFECSRLTQSLSYLFNSISRWTQPLAVRTHIRIPNRQLRIEFIHWFHPFAYSMESG